MFAFQAFLLEHLLVGVLSLWAYLVWKAPWFELFRLVDLPREISFFDLKDHDEQFICVGMTLRAKRCTKTPNDNRFWASALRNCLISTDPTHISFRSMLESYILLCLCPHHKDRPSIARFLVRWETEMIAYHRAAGGSRRPAASSGLPGAYASEVADDEEHSLAIDSPYASHGRPGTVSNIDKFPIANPNASSNDRSPQISNREGTTSPMSSKVKPNEKYSVWCSTIKGLSIPDSKRGYIYILSNEDDPGLVKIGYTQNVARRLVQWRKDCGIDYHLEYQSHEIPFAQRIEKIIHAELRPVRYLKACPGHPKLHKEWFRISLEGAKKTVDYWIHWMMQFTPYNIDPPHHHTPEFIRWLYWPAGAGLEQEPFEAELRESFLKDSDGKIWMCPEMAPHDVDDERDEDEDLEDGSCSPVDKGTPASASSRQPSLSNDGRSAQGSTDQAKADIDSSSLHTTPSARRPAMHNASGLKTPRRRLFRQDTNESGERDSIPEDSCSPGSEVSTPLTTITTPPSESSTAKTVGHQHAPSKLARGGRRRASQRSTPPSETPSLSTSVTRPGTDTLVRDNAEPTQPSSAVDNGKALVNDLPSISPSISRDRTAADGLTVRGDETGAGSPASLPSLAAPELTIVTEKGLDSVAAKSRKRSGKAKQKSRPPIPSSAAGEDRSENTEVEIPDSQDENVLADIAGPQSQRNGNEAKGRDREKLTPPRSIPRMSKRQSAASELGSLAEAEGSSAGRGERSEKVTFPQLTASTTTPGESAVKVSAAQQIAIAQSCGVIESAEHEQTDGRSPVTPEGSVQRRTRKNGKSTVPASASARNIEQCSVGSEDLSPSPSPSLSPSPLPPRHQGGTSSLSPTPSPSRHQGGLHPGGEKRPTAYALQGAKKSESVGGGLVFVNDDQQSLREKIQKQRRNVSAPALQGTSST